MLAALVGADVGPMVTPFASLATMTPFASLATMLVLSFARREKHDVRVGRLTLLGLWATPVIVAATTVALILAVELFS